MLSVAGGYSCHRGGCARREKVQVGEYPDEKVTIGAAPGGEILRLSAVSCRAEFKPPTDGFVEGVVTVEDSSGATREIGRF